MRRLALIVPVALFPLGALAQQDDRDYLTALLEDNLSTADQQVTITGFKGALSSRATMDKLAISDAEGAWLRDRSSTNGTIVTLTDGQQILCAPEQMVRVPVGASIAFGDYWLTVAG